MYRPTSHALTAVAFALALGLSTSAMDAQAQSTGRFIQTQNGSTTPSMTLPNFESIVQRVGPAVVNISSESTKKTSGMSPFGMDPDDPMFEFFRHFGGPQFKVPPKGGRAPAFSQGSGFIISADGLILTNAHVVDGATEVTVKLTDKREFKAKVLGFDKPTDVAVLRIDAKNLPTVPLGDPSRSKVGEWVLAIGSPFGFENSVTAGIISAKSRSLPNEGYVPFIQTDVAINPGNSGGPLLNLNGEVIGINSQIYSRSGGYQGVSFAIPMNVAAQVRDDILATGKVTRGRLGIGIQSVNQALAESFGLKTAGGALISSVEKNSPAELAGLKSGDVIIEINGERVQDSSDLPPRVAAIKPGNAAHLKIWRKNEVRDVDVKVGQVDEAIKTSKSNAFGKDTETQNARLGISARSLTKDEARQAEVPGGILVLDSSGAAERAGIQAGDLILSINGQAVDSVEHMKTIVTKAGKNIALLIQRNDARIFIPVELN